MFYLSSRSMQRGCVLLTGALLALVLGGAPHHAAAQTEVEHRCTITAREERVLRLDCSPGYATDHDQVLVFGDLPGDFGDVGAEVRSLPDIPDGALVFDAGADGAADVVVLFRPGENGALVARIYDDETGDDQVAFNVQPDGGIQIIEPGPVVEMTAPDGWWQRGNLVNFNLDICVDGQVRGSFGYYFWDLLALDGVCHVEIHVRDDDKDGRPDHEWRQIYLPLPESYGYERTEVMVSTRDNEKPIAGSVLWPYLGAAPYGPDMFTKPSYYSSPPPVGVDWETGKVTHVNEFVASRASSSNYFIYSLVRLEEGAVSAADFENPFMYYDLSGGEEALPTLMIRNAYFSQQDPFLKTVLGSTMTSPAMNDISYVWRYPTPGGAQPAAPAWDYKLDLVGTHAYTDVVKIGDLSVVTQPYDRFPYWVTGQAWGLAAFVADEGAHQLNSEGISAWGAVLEQLNPDSYQYLAGQRDRLPLDEFEHIPAGYRGEVAPELFALPRLYLSGADRKLHLKGATSGVWNIDDVAEVRYANLDTDGYLDQWQYLEDGQVQGQLNLVADYLVYAGDDAVALKRTALAQSIFETPPPRNTEEWLLVRDQLAANRAGDAPGDLAAVFTRTSGPEWRVTAAQLRDFRITGAGFRFVLELGPGFTVQGADELNLASLRPGEYVVGYDGGFSVQPLTAPRISLALQAPADGGITAHQPVALRAWVTNAGLADTRGLTLTLTAGQGAAAIEIGRQRVDALAAERTPVTFSWQPPAAGDWNVDLRLEDAGGAVWAEARQVVPVRAGVAAEGSAPDQAGGPLPAIAGLAVLALCVGWVARLGWRRAPAEADDRC